MKTEFEVKFYPVEKAAIIDQLKQRGARLIQPEVTMLVSVYNQTRNPHIAGDYVRLRHEGDKTRLSIKLHAQEGGKVSDQKELDVIVSDFAAMEEILTRIGLRRTGYQEKLRETWQLNRTEVVIDTWPGLEPNIEIEGDSEAAVQATAALLGFDWNDRIVTSIVEIYMRVYGLTAPEVLALLEHATFADNPFGNLKMHSRTSGSAGSV